MIRMAWQFMLAMLRHQWARWQGWEIFAPGSVQEYRQRRCDRCLFNEDGQCMECKCLILAKTMMALERCPRGYWSRVWLRKSWTPGPK